MATNIKTLVTTLENEDISPKAEPEAKRWKPGEELRRRGPFSDKQRRSGRAPV